MNFFSYDSCTTLYVFNNTEPYKITPSLKLKNNKIIFVPNNFSNWTGVKFKIYAIK